MPLTIRLTHDHPSAKYESCDCKCRGKVDGIVYGSLRAVAARDLPWARMFRDLDRDP